jgi:tetratricopeptide (TPR) repeat protein
MPLFRVLGFLSMLPLLLNSTSEGSEHSQFIDTQNRSPKSITEEKPKERKGSSHQFELIREWRSAVAQHRPGMADSAAAVIGSWPAADLKIVIDYVTKQANQAPNSTKRRLSRERTQQLLDLTDQEVQTGDLDRLLKQGALLHTDIALLDLGKGENRDDKMHVAAFVDGRIIAIASQLHWTIARQLISSIPQARAQNPIVRQWYVVTTAFLQSRRLLAYADQNLKCALKTYPSDEIFLFYAGVLHEVWASPLNQNIQLPQLVTPSYSSMESELKLAGEYFQMALDANPNYADAHLHLGRIYGLLGYHKQALAELKLAATSIKDPPLSYYLSLFLGCEFEMLSQPEKAEEYYKRAATLYPVAQSPLLALSHLYHENTGTKDALIPLRRALTLPRNDIWKDDPWWVYDLSHVRDAEALVAEMRRMFGELPR